MAPDSNPAQIAPGDEAGVRPPDTPYSGPANHEGHVGYISLNQAFSEGAQAGY